MKQFDIEAYLESELSQKELQAFEQEMQQNKELAQEVQLQKVLAGDLKTQLLREHITAALSEGAGHLENDQPSGSLPWTTILGGLAVLLTAIAFLFLFNQKETTETPTTIPDPVTQQEDPPTTETVPPSSTDEKTKEPITEPVPPKEDKPAPAKKKEKKKTQPQKPPVKKSYPIAEAKPLPDLRPPSHPSPQVRGGSEEDTEHKALLDAVWYTDFPPANTTFEAPLDKSFDLLKERDFTSAYVRLQMLERKMPDNDSLFFLKGYTLLEMGEGVEAFNYFNKIKQPPADWQAHIDWYKGLAYLLAKDPTQAATVFGTIKEKEKHPFQQQSSKAFLMVNDE